MALSFSIRALMVAHQLPFAAFSQWYRGHLRVLLGGLADQEAARASSSFRRSSRCFGKATIFLEDLMQPCLEPVRGLHIGHRSCDDAVRHPLRRRADVR